MDLDPTLTPVPVGHGTYTLHVPEGWQQGRGAYGGLVIGGMVRAALHADPDPARPVRAVDAHLLGPVVAGGAALRVTPLRNGSNVAASRVVVEQGGEVQAQATVVRGRDRPSFPDWIQVEAPRPPPWPEVPELVVPREIAPPFVQAFEFRPRGPLPYTGGEEAWSEGWIRERPAARRRDAAWLAALADAWWLACVVRVPGLRPAATLIYTLHVLVDPGALDPVAPLYFRGRGLVMRGGYGVEQRELWTAGGELVALNQQGVVLIK